MIRQVSAITIAACLSAPALFAQTPAPQKTELTIKAASADVHKFAMIASPVIAKVQSGTVLAITRNLGSWVEVPWQGGEDGVAFIHVSADAIAIRAVSDPTRTASTSSSPASMVPVSSAPSASVASSARTAQMPVTDQPGSKRPVYVSLPTHQIGVGARLNASTRGFGGSVRKWWADQIGVQFDVSHSSLDSIDGPTRMTSMQFAPSVLYSLPDGVADSLWVRPYAGAGLSINRAKLSNPTLPLDESFTSTSKAFQVFGGAEATFSGAPRLAISADLGYRKLTASPAGFAPHKVVFSLSGHWYVK